MTIFLKNLVAGFLLLGLPHVAQAQVKGPVSRAPSPAEIEHMLRTAKPFPKPKRPVDPSQYTTLPSLGGAAAPPPRIVPGKRPTVTQTKRVPLPPLDPADSVGPQNWGTNPDRFNTPQHFSDAIVDPGAVENFPFSAVGKLLFKFGGQSFVCSGALIDRSIVLTAGHCVHEGNNSDSGWHTKFVFIPALTGAAKPFGQVTGFIPVTTGQWFATGDIEQGWDIAMIVVNKKVGATNQIGDEAGALGWCVENCLLKFNMLTTLGYPVNYANGKRMNWSQHLSTLSENKREYFYGTGMEGGSSGGPHVANLGDLSDTSTPGGFPNRSIVFAVESHGPEGDPKVGFASSTSGFNNRNNVIGLFNVACEEARGLHGNNSCDFIDE